MKKTEIENYCKNLTPEKSRRLEEILMQNDLVESFLQFWQAVDLHWAASCRFETEFSCEDPLIYTETGDTREEALIKLLFEADKYLNGSLKEKIDEVINE